MSANFSLSRNSQLDNDSFKSSCNVVAVVSDLSLNNLAGIFWEGVPFLEFIVFLLFFQYQINLLLQI